MRITLQAEDSAASEGVKQKEVVMEAQTANGDAGDPATDSEESNAVRYNAWHTFVYISIRTHAHYATGGGFCR